MLPVELIDSMSLVEGIVITPDVNVSVPLIVEFPESVAPFTSFIVMLRYDPPPESACADAPPVRTTAPAPDPVIEPEFDIFPFTVMLFVTPSHAIAFPTVRVDATVIAPPADFVPLLLSVKLLYLKFAVVAVTV
jgi:hypothetical protein